VLYDVQNPPSGPAGSIQVWAFWDQDGVFNGDETTFASSLPSGEGKVTSLDTGGMAPGTIYVGVAAENASVRRWTMPRPRSTSRQPRQCPLSIRQRT